MKLIATLAALALAIPALAQDAAPQGPAAPPAPGEERTVQVDPSMFDPDRWSGEVSLPGGMTQEFVVNLRIGESGQGSGRMDIPMQGVTNLDLTDVAQEGDKLRFTLRPPQAPEAAWAKFEFTVSDDGKSARGTLSQRGQVFPASLTKVEAGAEVGPRRPQTPKAPFPYTERELSFTNANDGTRLVGTLTVPGKPPAGELASATQYPAVLLISGSGPQDRDSTIMGHKPFLIIADHLARAGIATLRFDDRGVGGSTGDTMQSTLLDFVDDAKAAVQMLKLQPDIDPLRIVVLGHSEGAMVAAEVAANSQDVAGAILLAGPAVPGSDLLIHQAELIMRSSGVGEEAVAESAKWQRILVDRIKADAPEEEQAQAIREMVTIQARAASALAGQPNPEIDPAQIDAVAGPQLQQLRTPWFRFFLLYDPRVALRKVRVPVLVLNGERDLQVDPAQNLPEMKAAFAESQNPDATIKQMADLNHLFQSVTGEDHIDYGQIEETFAPAAMVQIEAWLKRQFGM